MVKQGQKYHILYKTTCVVTGRYYVGCHSTWNIDDGYLGSGKFLKNSIKKYGIDNHHRETLELFECRKDLMLREREIVNEEMLKDTLCMNLKRGGEGGLSLVDKATQRRISQAGAAATNNKFLIDTTYREYASAIIRDRNKKLHQQGIMKPVDWTGKKHSYESKLKMSISAKNRITNSQYGTHWITNGVINKKIKKITDIPTGWKLGRII